MSGGHVNIMSVRDACEPAVTVLYPITRLTTKIINFLLDIFSLFSILWNKLIDTRKMFDNVHNVSKNTVR